MVVYFTGTGNSRYCAQALAEQLEDRCVDAFHYIRQGIGAELTSERPWVFVAPTYAWRVPKVFAEFIRSGHFSGSREAYFVLTCGGDTGAAWRELAALCKEKGLSYRGLLPVVMPDNYLVLFPSPQPDEIREKLMAAVPALTEAAGRILAGAELVPRSTGLLDRIKSGPVNWGMYRFLIRPKRFFATDACVGCGKCGEVCPLGNIRLERDRPAWGRRCTHCMACIDLCPVQAIEYGKASRGKQRYRCPEYRSGGTGPEDRA